MTVVRPYLTITIGAWRPTSRPGSTDPRMSGVVRNGVRELMGHTHTDRDWEAYEDIDQSLRLASPELRLGGFRNWWDLLRSPISIPGTVRYHLSTDNGHPRQQDCMAIYLGLRSPLSSPSPEEIVVIQNGELLTTRGMSPFFPAC